MFVFIQTCGMFEMKNEYIEYIHVCRFRSTPWNVYGLERFWNTERRETTDTNINKIGYKVKINYFLCLQSILTSPNDFLYLKIV